METINRKITKEQSLDEYLSSLHFCKKDIHLLKMEKRIRVNNQTIVSNVNLAVNDKISVNIIKDEDNNVTCVDEPLSILYEDDFLLVVDKPTGIIIHDDTTNSKTLDGMVANYYLQTGQRHPIYHIHRLDKETSGAILYCKQTFLVALLEEDLAAKRIQREYLALVSGTIKNNLTVNSPIGKDRHQNNKYRISLSGKEAITHVFVLKKNKNTTLVKCRLETGRTHQIRVHLSSISHPIIGDDIYGTSNGKRMMLHSYSLHLHHPVDGKELNIICESQDFKV